LRLAVFFMPSQTWCVKMNFPASDFQDISTDVHINHSVILAHRPTKPANAATLLERGSAANCERIRGGEEPGPENLLLYA
jgi:hypothetical protein